jgi:voltage-gated potassium channel
MTDTTHTHSQKVIAWIDRIVQPMAVISVCLYLLEGELSLRNQWDNSYQSPRVFLIAERIVAGLFTLELAVRWWRSPAAGDQQRFSYPFTVWGAIDLACVLPFWLGFVVPTSFLGLIRAFRILRLLKFFRYSRTLQLTALKFYRAYHNLKGLGFSLGIIWLFFAVVCINLENAEQPDNFGSLLDGIWFTIVTATTVGYGDISPVGTLGKLFVGVMLVPIISTMGLAFSAFANACETVQTLEDDPAIDPIEEWRKERERMRRRREANREYHMKM